MDLAALREKVEEGVQATIVPALLEAAKRRHAKKGWRNGCDCSYCDRKRSAVAHLQFSPFWMNREQRDAWRAREQELTRNSLGGLFEA